MKRVIGTLLLGGAMLTACSPEEYKVSRETTINAPAELIFGQVNDHRNRDQWSPWEQMDPQMTKSYSGPESGVGAIYEWSGNDSVGTGSLEIIESVPHSYIKSNLVFTSPWESSSIIEWNFDETESGTQVTWSVSGSFPGYLFWMSEATMDEMMGPDFERGLTQLKALAESMPQPKESPDLTYKDVESMTYFYTAHDISWEEMSSDFYGQEYGKIFNYLAEDAAKVKHPAMAVFHEWDEENERTKMEVAIACDSEKKGNDMVKRGTTYAGKTVMGSFVGPYEQTEELHNAIYTFIVNKGMQMNGSPWEVYIAGPGDDPNPENWVTEVYYPVAEAEMAAE